MTEYVVGFLLSEDEVLLVEKARPEWQRGKLNGPGGKIEPGEAPIRAMAREFEEETHLPVTEFMWKLFCTITASDDLWKVYFYSCRLDVRPLLLQEDYAEEVPRWVPVRNLAVAHRIVDNLRWLVPMAAAKSPVLAVVRELRDG